MILCWSDWILPPYASHIKTNSPQAWTLCIVKIHPPKLYELGSSAAFVTLVQISASEVPHARKMGRFRCRVPCTFSCDEFVI